MEVGQGPEECEVVETCLTEGGGADERSDAALMNLQSPTPVSAQQWASQAAPIPDHNAFKPTESWKRESFC